MENISEIYVTGNPVSGSAYLILKLSLKENRAISY